MTTSSRILRNAAALFASQPITWTLSLVFLVLVPRNVGPAEWGEFVIAGSVGEASRYLGSVLAVRLALAPLLIFAVLAFARLAGYSAHTQVIVGIVALSTAVAYIGRTAGSGLQAIQKMHINAIADVVSSVLLTAAAVALLKFAALGVVSICIVGLLATLAGQAVQWSGLSREVRLRPLLDRPFLRKLIRAGIPYWSNQFFFIVYVWIDAIILSLLTTPKEVGWYGVCVQLIGALGFVPSIITTVVFPELSRTFLEDRARMDALARSSFRLLITLSLPMVVGLALVSTTAVTTIYGGWFVDAGPVLTILAFVLLPAYISTLGNVLVIAADRQVLWTWVMGAMCVINPLLNLVTIPYFHIHYGNGAYGAAFALLATDMLTAGISLVLLPASIRAALSATAPAVLRATIATAIMAAAVWPFRSFVLPVPVLVGAVTFVTSALVLRVFPAEDLQAVHGLLSRIGARFLRLFVRRPRIVHPDTESAA